MYICVTCKELKLYKFLFKIFSINNFKSFYTTSIKNVSECIKLKDY